MTHTPGRMKEPQLPSAPEQGGISVLTYTHPPTLQLGPVTAWESFHAQDLDSNTRTSLPPAADLSGTSHLDWEDNYRVMLPDIKAKCHLNRTGLGCVG